MVDGLISGTSCPFCGIASGARTPEVVAYRDQHTAVFPCLHQQPRNQGHMLVVPVIHVAQIYDVEGELAGALMTTLARVARALKKACAADGGLSAAEQRDAWWSGCVSRSLPRGPQVRRRRL